MRPGSGEVAGFLRFGGTHQQLKVFQIFTLDTARRQGVAGRLLNELVRYGEQQSVLSITARVAADLPANRFWVRHGFALHRTEPGGRTTNRKINVYLRELDVPSLFRKALPLDESPALDAETITFRDRPRLPARRWVLDLNVVFDALRQRDRGQSLWLLGAVPIVVTAELIRELERTSTEADDEFLQAARSLPRLPEPPADQVARLTSALRDSMGLTSDATSKRGITDTSDLRHLATCIYHRAYGFVTRDGRILLHAEALRDQYGLRVAAPADLVPSGSGAADPGASSVTAELDHRLLTGGALKDNDRAALANFLERLGLSADRRDAVLNPGTTQQPAEQRVVRVGDRIVGVAALAPPTILGQSWIAHVYVEESRAESQVTAEHLFDWLLRPRSFGKLYRIDLHSVAGKLTTKQVALDCGFRRVQTGHGGPSAALSKLVYGGFVLPDGWRSFSADFKEQTGLRLAPAMPTWSEASGKDIEINQAEAAGNRIPLFDFETLISPGLLLPVGRTGVVVPVRPSYAEQLLPPTVKQSSLLPAREAALRLERAYFFRAGRHGLLPRGTIVVFYLSEPRMEAAAVARATFSATLSKEEAVATLSRQGVLTSADIQARADTEGRVTAFTFDSLTGIPRTVSYSDLKRLDCVGPANYVAAEAISHDQLLRIVSAGFGELDS
jgi:predicted nucleic acid-binding protein